MPRGVVAIELIDHWRTHCSVMLDRAILLRLARATTFPDVQEVSKPQEPSARCPFHAMATEPRGIPAATILDLNNP